MYLGLTEYLENSPLLAGQSFHFDFIPSQPTAYTLTIPTNTPEIVGDALGNTKCQLNFYLVAKNIFGDDILNNIENLEFFQKVRKWFEKQNRNKIFPDLGEGIEVTGVYATTDGYIETTNTSIGQYQIQAKVEYVRKNTNPNKILTNW